VLSAEVLAPLRFVRFSAPISAIPVEARRDLLPAIEEEEDDEEEEEEEVAAEAEAEAEEENMAACNLSLSRSGSLGCFSEGVSEVGTLIKEGVKG
jgi:hypothetical protein